MGLLLVRKFSHIEDAKIEDVRSFFFKHYTPRNSILSIAADLEFEKNSRTC